MIIKTNLYICLVVVTDIVNTLRGIVMVNHAIIIICQELKA